FESLRDRGLVRSLHETPEGVFFEGAGDAIWDARRQLLWLGHGQRSSLAARDTLRRVFGVDTVSLELASPHFYHLDTCLCALSGGEILWYPPAFTCASRELLQALAGDALIEVAEHDARHFSVNSVSIGRELVMGHCSNELRERLQALGYRVTLVPLDSFWRSGGSAWCLTLRLDHASRARVDFPG
ncbi:MAG TPA: arginine deiminase-related protein, partial [Burkholderiaceae bacterium]|nr:arginine deiminase-related protein [Burkholderiaceae bacterium]